MGEAPMHLDYFQGSMFEAVEKIAKESPELTAFTFIGRDVGYPKLIEEIDRVARALRAIGVQEGDKVTIAMPNCPQAVYMFYAVNPKLLDNIDFTKFDTTNVTDMSSMFSSLRGGNGTDTLTLDLSSFSTPALQKASYFMSTYGLGSITNLVVDMSNFDFSNVTDLSDSYSRLYSLSTSSLDHVTVYVKDQAAKDFVVNKSSSLYGTRAIQSSEVVIK